MIERTVTVVKKSYCYWFYIFYKFSLWIPTPYSRDYLASVLMGMVEALFLCSLNLYYIEFINPYFDFSPFSPTFLFPAIGIMFIHYRWLIKGSNWKGYIKEFDRLPKYKNTIGGLIVFFIVVMIITGMVISMNVMENKR